MISDVANIIEYIVDQMNNTIEGKFNPDDGKTYFCTTKWARVGKPIFDELDNEYLITEVVLDVYIVATPIGHVNDLDGLCSLVNPFWITGTRLAANREWTIASNNLMDKLPLIWMLELMSETIYGRGSTLERDMELQLFFLDETDPAQYYTAEHRKQVVEPMQQLMVEFIETINRLKEFKTVENYRIRTFSRFGTESEQGVLENVLDANLSGLRLDLTLSKYKENCKC
jgi:hypothetical protein